MLWNSAGSMANMICQWLITVLIVRLSGGYGAAGLLSLAMTVYGVFSPIAQYRMYTYQVSDVKGENSVGEYFSFRLLTCSFSLVLCAAYALVTCPLESVLPILLYGLYKTVTSVIDVMHATDQRFKRMDFIGKSLMMQGIISLIAFVAVFAFSENLNWALIAMALGCAVVGVAYDLPRTLRLSTIRVRITWKKARFLLFSCAPMVLGSIFAACAPSIPRQYLFAKLGESLLGAYSSVSAPVAVIQMSAAYIYNPLMGYFADFYDKKDARGFLRLFAKSCLAMLGASLLCGILLCLFGQPLLTLMFGSSIQEYLYTLPLIIASAIAVAFMGFFNDLLITFRNLKGTMVGGLVALVTSGLLTVPCVNIFELNGISITLLVAAFASCALMAMFILRACRNMGSSMQEPSPDD